MINLPNSLRSRISPIANLTPQSLSRQLDEFHAGVFANVARTFEAIEQRDDILKGVASKRKKSPARLPWQVLTLDDSPQAAGQKLAVERLIQTLDVRAAHDKNLRGGLPLLIEQMMDSVGKRYACHELRFQKAADGTPGVALQFVPLWFFENKDGALHFIDDKGVPARLNPDEWMITVGDGLMEATSIAYLYKHLPLRDWLLYCERNGMPGVKGTTDALPGTPEWENARQAVESFGAEFSALLTRGATLEAIDLSTKGTLPYPALVARMDQAIVALWRGSDLTTLSSKGVGASLQKSEAELIESHDCHFLSDTLNTQLISPFLRHNFGDRQPILVRFNLQPDPQLEREIAVLRLLKEINVVVDGRFVLERLGLQVPPARALPPLLSPSNNREEKNNGKPISCNPIVSASDK